MPPRATRRGAARGGAASRPTPKQEDTADASTAAAQLASLPAATTATATVISSSESTPAPSSSATSSRAQTVAPTSQPSQPSQPSHPPTSNPPAQPTRSFVFKPKVVRRADDERKALAEQEEKKFNDRAAEEARLKRAASRGRGRGGRGGRGRGGRGRGDFGGGRDGLVRRTVAPDGPFSQVPGAMGGGGPGGRGGGGFGFRGSGANGGGFAAGGSGGLGGGGRGGGGGGSTFSAVADGHEYDPRLNTDTFMGRASRDHAGDAEADADPAGPASSSANPSSKPKMPNLLPMGIRREEHREAEVVVATTAELEAADAAAAAAVAAANLEGDESDDDLFIENTTPDLTITTADDDEVWKRAIKTGGSVTLVGADGQEIEVTDIDTLAEKRQELAAAAAAQAQAQASAAAGTTVSVKQEDDDAAATTTSLLSSLDQQTKKASRKKAAAAAAAARAPKDAEDLTVEQGLQAMLHDLAMDPPREERQDVDDNTSAPPAADDADKEPPRREGRLFLFQFPPVLPSLKAFAPGEEDDGADTSAGPVKSEPGTDGDVVMLDGSAPIDLTDSSSASASSAKDRSRANLAAIGQGGFLGTLSIHQSGRAELSWGGMTFQMMPGTDVQFATTAVLLEQSDEKRKPGEAGAAAALVGNAFGMGPVGGKYNLVPVFSDEEEWVVGPDELEGAEV